MQSVILTVHVPRAECPDARPGFQGATGALSRAEARTERIVEEAIKLAEWIIVKMNKGHDLIDVGVCFQVS